MFLSVVQKVTYFNNCLLDKEAVKEERKKTRRTRRTNMEEKRRNKEHETKDVSFFDKIENEIVTQKY